MEALKTIQQKLKAPKNQLNKFGRYRYRSCEDILEAVKPLLAETGAQLTLTDDIVEVGGRIYVKAMATLFDGKATESSTAYAREAESKKGMDESQITGTASSYARKYALNGLFLIDDNQDADTDSYNSHQEERPQSKPQQQKPAPQPQQAGPAGGPDTPAERDEINNLLASQDKNGNPLFSPLDFEQLTKMRANNTAAQVIEWLKSEISNRRTNRANGLHDNGEFIM